MEDSFVAVIESRSPAKIANVTSVLGEVQEENLGEDSIVEDSVAPQGVTEVTPGKSPRIEDSVEAIDALEEAIEQAGQSLAAVQEDAPSPTKGRKPATKNATKAKVAPSKVKPAPKANTSKPLSGGKPVTQKSPSTKAAALKTTATRPTTGNQPSQPSVAKRSAANKVTQTSPKPNPTPSKTTTSNVRVATTKPVKKRVSSISNPPFVPTKSTKAPTSSTFTLPGEAVSARLKAQREERLKQEEQDLNAKRKFKARPAPSGRLSNAGSATLPRQTTSSKARESLAKGELPTAPRVVKPRVSSTGAVVGIKTGPSKPAPTAAMKGRPSLTATLPTRPVNPSPNKAAIAAGPAVKTTGSVRGKSTMNSFKTQKEQQDKIVKEKMEAAKKARIEAAERGRAASKEWAERRKREAEARKADGGAMKSPKATTTSSSGGVGESAVGKVVVA